MNQSIQTTGGPDSAAIESVLVQGDLSKLTAGQRVSYYNRVCDSLGLNPLTRPFEFINLSGKLVFYARRDCTDQLRNINNVTVRIVSREKLGEDVYVVTAQATLPNGRSDESTGAVPIARLQGENLANALMKAETKAKRRVTLSICGLSVLDESELDGVRGETHPTLGAASPHGEPEDHPEPESTEFYDSIIARIATVRNGLDTCASHAQAAALRAELGSKAAPQAARLTRDFQRAREENLVGFEGLKEISRRWNHCDRQLAKLEAQYPAPVVEDEGEAIEDEASPEYDGR